MRHAQELGLSPGPYSFYPEAGALLGPGLCPLGVWSACEDGEGLAEPSDHVPPHSQYSIAGDDAVTEGVTDLVRGPSAQPSRPCLNTD